MLPLMSLHFHTLILIMTGTLEVDLLSVPQHAKVPHHCSSKQLPEVNPKAETVSLFKHRRLRGWWPVLRHVGGGNSGYKLLAVSVGDVGDHLL